MNIGGKYFSKKSGLVVNYNIGKDVSLNLTYSTETNTPNIFKSSNNLSISNIMLSGLWTARVDGVTDHIGEGTMIMQSDTPMYFRFLESNGLTAVISNSLLFYFGVIQLDVNVTEGSFWKAASFFP